MPRSGRSLKLRLQGKGGRDARRAIADEYMAALGMLAYLPLGKAATERAGLTAPA